jgi:hypothetical protein
LGSSKVGAGVAAAVGAGVAAGFGVAAGTGFLAAAAGFGFSLGFSFVAAAGGVGAPGGGCSGVCAAALAEIISQAARIDRGRRSFISGVIPVRL